MKGKIIKLKDVTVVPFEQNDRKSWTCVIVASNHASYPVGGYNIVVDAAELEKGTVINLRSTYLLIDPIRGMHWVTEQEIRGDVVLFENIVKGNIFAFQTVNGEWRQFVPTDLTNEYVPVTNVWSNIRGWKENVR